MGMTAQVDAVFHRELKRFVNELNRFISTDDGQWTVKGFIDVYRNVYTISSDTKIVSKLLEIHLFPEIVSFAERLGYQVVPADHQNYYPDFSFILASDPTVRFAIDLKTTYRLPENPDFCNGFTLGSHGEYFINRASTKNIQFPYASYRKHYCLGIIYTRVERKIDETRLYALDELHSITSVTRDFQFFVAEKWKIASDKSGSGNTANIGSIQKIDDLLAERGMFSRLGEAWFDDYWMNYGKITVRDENGQPRKIRNLKEFVAWRGGDPSLVVPKARKITRKKPL